MRTLVKTILILSFSLALPLLALAQRKTIPTPLLPHPSQDPWVTLHDGLYYHVESRHGGIVVRRAKRWEDLASDTGRMIWRAPASGPHSRNVWAPELHRSGLCWCIIFAADDGDNRNHRLWVLHSKGPDPFGPYEGPEMINTPGWAIDGTILDRGGNRYLIWSGWPGNVDGRQNLYIARLKDPGTIEAPVVLLTEPTEPWEQAGMPICEGPAVLTRGKRLFVVYSAGGSWTADHCLGMLELQGSDPLEATSWKKFGPVFKRNDRFFGPGHPSFVSPDIARTWMFYNVKTKREDGWGDRRVYAKEIGWTAEGWPIFGEP